MKNREEKTREKEMAESDRKAKGAAPENQTSAKDAKKVLIKKTKTKVRKEK
ncbi:hypothetical protein [Pedobacter gandavensis]|uniref:hypothetical protein n=1 Tax=Pedobacter gandavensis TaxID=2679963 RepID=UPI00292CBD13|nr:hypothetical protein [Pedobacter gandavensis]